MNKKVIVFLAAFLVTVSAFAVRSTNSNTRVITDTYTNALGQVIEVAVGYASTTAQRTTVPMPLVTIITNANYASTSVTPLGFGAMLVCPNGLVVGSSTGNVGVASGLTTNDWELLD